MRLTTCRFSVGSSICSICVSCPGREPQTAIISAVTAATSTNDHVVDCTRAPLGADVGVAEVLTVLVAVGVLVGDEVEGAVAGLGALATGTVAVGGDGGGRSILGAAADAVGVTGVTPMTRGKLTPGCESRQRSRWLRKAFDG